MTSTPRRRRAGSVRRAAHGLRRVGRGLVVELVALRLLDAKHRAHRWRPAPSSSARPCRHRRGIVVPGGGSPTRSAAPAGSDRAAISGVAWPPPSAGSGGRLADRWHDSADDRSRPRHRRGRTFLSASRDGHKLRLNTSRRPVGWSVGCQASPPRGERRHRGHRLHPDLPGAGQRIMVGRGIALIVAGPSWSSCASKLALGRRTAVWSGSRGRAAVAPGAATPRRVPLCCGGHDPERPHRPGAAAGRGARIPTSTWPTRPTSSSPTPRAGSPPSTPLHTRRPRAVYHLGPAR